MLPFLVAAGLVFSAAAQATLLETYHTGTKVTYYPDGCETEIPEATNKISFCDRVGNLGVVEASYGLNARNIQDIVINHYNDDVVFRTSSGISILKEDGSWDNFPDYAAPRSSPNSNAASIRNAMVTPDGKLLFTHLNMDKLHILDLETKAFEILPYLNNEGGSLGFLYSQVFTYDPVTQKTYILASGGTTNYLFSLAESDLQYLGIMPGSSSSALAGKKFLVHEGYLYIGSSNGLYKTNLSDLSDYVVFNTGNQLSHDYVRDFQFDQEGYLWIALSGYSSGALAKMNVTDNTFTTYTFPSSNPAINYNFESVAIDAEGTLWATAINASGYLKILFGEAEPQVTFVSMAEITATGFPMTYAPHGVHWYNNKIYLFTNDYSSSQNENYEAAIYANGQWSGINDDQSTNISSKFSNRYRYAYPAEDGVYFFNDYDGGILAYWDSEGNSSRQYSLGGTNSFLVDNDQLPVIYGGAAKKIDSPLVYNLQDPGTNQIVKLRRYKDQVWAYDRPGRRLFVYKNNKIVAQHQLDEEAYGYLYDFNLDSEGNAWFFRMVDSNIEAKKFDPITATTTNYQTNSGSIGYLNAIIPMPNGKMAFVGSSAVIYFDGVDFTKYTGADYSHMYSNMLGGMADVDGRIHIFTHDAAKVITIENPGTVDVAFSVLEVEGTNGLIPYVGFYRPAMSFDAEGNFWGHGSGKWLKASLENVSAPFLNWGETFGITGRVYLDVNENNQFDDGEGFSNQKVSLVAGDRQVDTFTASNGTYYFSFIGEETDYTITLPVINAYAVSEEPQKQVTLSSFEQNYEVGDFMLKSKNINSLVVKSSAKTGAWGFVRENFENTFVTAIGNISYTKTFSDLDLDFVFLKDPETPETPIPDIEEVNVFKFSPNGILHLVSSLTINPRNHQWHFNLDPSHYNQEEITVEPEITEVEEGTTISLVLGSIAPLETYIIEVKTALFSAEHTGNAITYGVSRIGSNDFTGDPDNPGGGKHLFLIPRLQDPRTGDLGDMSPYILPEDIYEEPPYIEPKDIYSDGPYSPPIMSSYDPNDKLANPGSTNEVTLTHIDKKWLTYTVRFQNDGNFSAKDVYVLDAIDEHFDLNTFSLLESTHPVQVSQIETEDSQVMKFAFNNIYLDYSANNLEASQGYVKFMIKAKDDIAPGTIVENTAAIYFDQNPPILTNIARNQFIELHSLGLRANPPHGGTVSQHAAGEYQEGQEIAVKAQAAEGFLFEHWTLNGEVASEEPEFTLTMPAQEALLIANFQAEAPLTYQLMIHVEPEGTGQIIVSIGEEEQVSPYVFEEGTQITLLAIPNDGYIFREWSNGYDPFTQNPLTVVLGQDTIFGAFFQSTTSIDEVLSDKDLQVFPNPARDKLSLRLPAGMDYLSLVDLQGIVLVEQSPKAPEAEISLEGLRPGFYFLIVRSGTTMLTRKILVVQ